MKLKMKYHYKLKNPEYCDKEMLDLKSNENYRNIIMEEVLEEEVNKID
jgi:hypothetical protein